MSAFTVTAIAACPFCEGDVRDGECLSCGRDPRAPRRICGQCGQGTPEEETSCCRCRTPFHSEMWWKIPLILTLFVLAFILAVVLQLAQ